VESQKNNKEEEEEYVCPENSGNGNYADPATCRRFYQVPTYLSIIFSDLRHWFTPYLPLGAKTCFLSHVIGIGKWWCHSFRSIGAHNNMSF